MAESKYPKIPKPADPKSAGKAAPKPAAAKPAAPKPPAKPPAVIPARPAPKAAPKPRKSQTPVKLVKRTTSGDGEGQAAHLGAAIRELLANPEDLGRKLHDRPAWMDEVAAILLIVFGMVTLLSLLNTSSTAAMSSAWSDTIRQFVGYVGAMLLTFMIVGAGLLIILPRIGVNIRVSWQRILTIEVAYLAFLAVLHLLAHDPEPRALARSGQGGGYIGWALSDLVFKVLGSGLALIFYGVIVVICLSLTFGIRRAHLRQGILAASKRLESLAERMKREPLPRSTGRVMARPVNAPQPANTADTAAVPPAVSLKESSEPLPRGPMVRPARAPEPAAAAIPAVGRKVTSKPSKKTEPAPDLTAPAVNNVNTSNVPSALATEPPDIPLTPSKPSKPAAKPAPVVPERTARYFTVEDFKEVRQPVPRVADLPPLSLLSDTELNKPTEQEVNANVRVIENTLLEFDIDVEVVDVKVGPAVTQYAVQPFREVTNDQGEVILQRVRVNKIASLSSDLALALSAKRLRIQPYVPGHPYMGIEVPNRTPSIVALRPVMESESFARAYLKRDAETGQPYEVPLAIPLGRDVSGAAFCFDLASMPHLLIAGTTGSGKSVCITALAVGLIMNNMPDRLKLVMLDPKMVELNRFNGLPHLLGPVETDMERIIGVLRWATREMDNRYKLLEAEAARNIEAYNKALGKARESEKLPYIVILVDEIGDLMLSRPDEMERTLTRLAQMARAVGIHLVVATQRPSVDIITGLIKANFPARISFAVASGVDSRVILDTTGAETLMGRGDMLYLAPDASGPQRLQGCFVSDSEIEAVMAYWKNWRVRQSQPDSQAGSPPWEIAMTRREALSDIDPLLEDAIDLVVREGEASASLIQRRLGIGYPRAAQLLDMLVELGVAGSLKEGGRAREVLLKPGMDKYKKLMGQRKR